MVRCGHSDPYGNGGFVGPNDDATLEIIVPKGGHAAEEHQATRTGYTFLGWNTAANGSGTELDPCHSEFDSDTVLYAVWSINSYYACFDTMGSIQGEEIIPELVIPYRTEFCLDDLAGTKDNHNFVGWYTQRYDEDFREYVIAERYSPDLITTMPGHDLYLYAEWAPYTFTVVYDADGGTEFITDREYTYATAGYLDECEFTKNGCEFDYWNCPEYDTQFQNGARITDYSSPDGATVTLNAVYSAH